MLVKPQPTTQAQVIPFSPSLSSAIEEFIIAKKVDGVSPKTSVWYQRMLKPFADAYGQSPLTSITARDMRAYILSLQERTERYTNAPQKPAQKGGLSDYSIDSHKRALFAFWSWTADEYDIANPMKNIKRPKSKTTTPKALDPADFVRLFDACRDDETGDRDRALLAFLADTGCRLGGLISLHMQHLDLEKRQALVTEKGGKTRAIYFTHFTGRLLATWLINRRHVSDAVFTSIDKGDALTASGVTEILRRLKKRAGVKGRVNPHAFRHNFARQYIKSGGDLATLSKLLGHAEVSITAEYYAVFVPQELAAFHEKHSPLKGWE